MGSKEPNSTPIPREFLEEQTLSRSLPTGESRLPNSKRKGSIEKRKSKLEMLYNKRDSSLSNSSSLYSTPASRSQIQSDDELEQFSFHGPYNPPEANLLLQNCYNSIANLREEVDSLRLRNHDLQTRLDTSEEHKRQVTSERNKLEQQLLQVSQELSNQQSRAQSLNAEVDTLDLEIDKLKRDNLRLRKLSFKAEEWQDKVIELENELVKSQRARRALENKCNHARMQNDKLRKENRKLQQTLKRQALDGNIYEKVAWLKESNEKLTHTLQEVTSLASVPNTLQHQVSTLISVVKELSSTNGRLKAEVMQCCDALSNYEGTTDSIRHRLLSLTPNPSSPNLSQYTRRKFGTLPAIRNRNRSISNSTDDLSPPKITTLFDELKDTIPEGSEKHEALAQLRHSTSFDEKPFTQFLEGFSRDSGIYSTLDLSNLNDHDMEEDLDISDNEINEPVNIDDPEKVKNRPHSLSFDFVVLSDLDESSPKSTSDGIYKSNSSKSTNSYKSKSKIKNLPKINVSNEDLLNGNIIPSRTYHSNPTTPHYTQINAFRSLLNTDDIYDTNHTIKPDIFNSTCKPLPIMTLITLIEEIMIRLNKTEPKVLNRELNRAFDMTYLAPISNELIRNVIHNIQMLPMRFQQLEKDLIILSQADSKEGLYQTYHSLDLAPFRKHLRNSKSLDSTEESSKDPSPNDILKITKREFEVQVAEFKKLINLIQVLLEEVANRRLASNELSLEYVDKVRRFSTPPPKPKIHVPETTHWNSTPKLPAEAKLCVKNIDFQKSSEALSPIMENNFREDLDTILKSSSDETITSPTNYKQSKINIDSLFYVKPQKRRTPQKEHSQTHRNSTKVLSPMLVRNGVVDYSPKKQIDVNKVRSLPHISKPKIQDSKTSPLVHLLKLYVSPSDSPSSSHSSPVESRTPSAVISPPISPHLPTPSTNLGINPQTAYRIHVVRNSLYSGGE